MKEPIRVLIVEDSEFDARILVGVLRKGGFDPKWKRVETASEMKEALAEQTWDVILSDYNLPEFSAPDALALLQQSCHDLPFIIISGGIGEDVAVAAMKAGAHDYLMKGNLARLVPAVEREMRDAEVRRGRRLAEEALRESEQRYRLLWENSTDAVVLMEREGKVLFANPALTEVFAFEPAEVQGKDFRTLLGKEAQAQFAHWAETYLSDDARTTRHTPIETVGCHRSGREVTLEIAFNQIELDEERRLVAFIRDITERRRAEEESLLLQGIAFAVQAAQDLEASLHIVLRTVCETSGWALGQAWLPRPDRRTLECSPAWYARNEGFLPFREASEQRHYDPGEGLPGKVWSAREPIWIADLTAVRSSPRAGVAREVGILAGVGIPVMSEDELVAVIEFFLTESREEDERLVKLFTAAAAQLGGVIREKRAQQELRANEEQFRVAREVQERLFPDAAPAIPGYDIAGHSQPAFAAGGDYFDYLPMMQGGLGVVVGDVTGHGIGPALLMAETRAYLRVLAQSNSDVGAILNHANQALAGDIDQERYITMLLVGLDPAARRLHYVNAGHPAGYVLGADGSIKQALRRTGVPLGIRPDTAYPDGTTVELAVGDVVLLLTDGIDEAISPEEDLYGIDRALDVIREHRDKSAREIVNMLFREVRLFAQDAPQMDDATVVVVKVS